MTQPSLTLAEPLAQIFANRAEADWAFDLLRDTTKRLGIQGAYDPRFALTLARRGSHLSLNLNFGGWLVLGFHGPGRVDLTLLANRVAWDERFDSFPFESKEGEPEARSYHLPLEMIRPMSSDLQAAWEATLEFIAQKFQNWKRTIHWKQNNPEIVEALFKPEQRERVFAGLLTETELRYERHLTAFYQDVSEEPAEYETQTRPELVEGEAGTKEILEAKAGYELQFQGEIIMNLDPQKVEQIIVLMEQYSPGWSFSDPFFLEDEIKYKKAAIAKAGELLSEAELNHLIAGGEFEEFVKRLDTIGKSTNLLFLGVPKSGDLNVLYHPTLDKSTFCQAMFDLLYGSGSSPDRLERYINYVQTNQLPNKWTFPTYFLFLCHPDTEIFVKPQTAKWFFEFMGYKDKYTTKPTPLAYETLLAMAQQLKAALQDFGPRDMVDIQSVIWVCYQHPEKTDPTKLAAPFSQIFVNREEAEWAFNFLHETLERLGVTNASDQRFALTLRYKNRVLRLNFGNWLVLDFCTPDFAPRRVDIALLRESKMDEYLKRSGSFYRKENEPEVSIYELPIELARSLDEDLKIIYERSMSYIAQRFLGWKASNLRFAHQPEIAEAIFDLNKRKRILSEGLIVIETDDSEEADELVKIGYSITDLAAETGLDEADLARWIRAIERKGQAIFYGPPGTGKTFVAEKLAHYLTAGSDGFWELVQFHPAYAYEDFIQGLRPESHGDHLSYPMKPGRFLEFCRQAARHSGPCILIIDEINRANLSRVFGELMYLLEYRNRAIHLAGGGLFHIPANIRLIGTMNTADRSIALVDHALRRRFAFIALYPHYDLLRRYHEREQTGFPSEKLITLLQKLNRAIGDPHYEVGVTFFLRPHLADELEDIWRMEIEPYLEEYFFDQAKTVADFRWEKIKPDLNVI